MIWVIRILPRRKSNDYEYMVHHIMRNQIDYILIDRNGIVGVKAYPGAEIESDHNKKLAPIRLRLERYVKVTLSVLT